MRRHQGFALAHVKDRRFRVCTEAPSFALLSLRRFHVCMYATVFRPDPSVRETLPRVYEGTRPSPLPTVNDVASSILGEFVERESYQMNSREVGSTPMSLGKLEAVAAAVAPSGWAGLSGAVERNAGEMDARGTATTLTGLRNLDAAAAAVAPSGWAGLAQAVERTACEMNPRDVPGTLDALSYLESDPIQKVCRRVLYRTLPQLASQRGELQRTSTTPRGK